MATARRHVFFVATWAPLAGSGSSVGVETSWDPAEQCLIAATVEHCAAMSFVERRVSHQLAAGAPSSRFAKQAPEPGSPAMLSFLMA